jgi:hypothetical protein
MSFFCVPYVHVVFRHILPNWTNIYWGCERLFYGLIIIPSLIRNALHTKKPALIRCWIRQLMHSTIRCCSLLFVLFSLPNVTSNVCSVKANFVRWKRCSSTRLKAYWRNRGLAPPILNLSTKWRQLVSFTPYEVHLRRKGLGIYWIWEMDTIFRCRHFRN